MREPTCTLALTQAPQGQPSPLQTPHGRPGVQPIFPASRGQAPHGWPMVHHSMATGFPIPRGCCWVFSATPRPLVRNPATSHCPLQHPFTHHGLLLASRAFPFAWGRCAAPATLSSLSRPLFPSLIPCLYPTGPPATLWRWPTGSSSIQGPFLAPLHGSLPSRPLVFGWFLSFTTCSGPFFLVPPPFPQLPVPIPHLVTCGFCFVARYPRPLICTVCSYSFPCCLLAQCCAPSGGALRFFLFIFLARPPPFPGVRSALWFPSLAAFVGFFNPPSCMHACQHCTGHRVTAPLGVRLRSPCLRGACPLAICGQARWAPLPHVTLLPSLSFPPPPSPVSRPPSYCCSPAPCALCCSSTHQGCIPRALTRLSSSALSSVL